MSLTKRAPAMGHVAGGNHCTADNDEFDHNEGPGLLASGWFWFLGAVSLACWAGAIWVAFRSAGAP